MSWVVIGEDKGKIKLVSKSVVTGLLPKGSYLTIEEGTSKFILRVDNSYQSESYSPSPLIIDMDLSPFSLINPCGYRELVMTQLKNHTDGHSIEAIKSKIIPYFLKNFGYTPRPTHEMNLPELTA